jgi:hypothetical protein
MAESPLRGFTWASYFDDTEEPWAVQVLSSYVDMIERGWQTANVQLLHPLPRGFRTRRVFGYDEAGRRQFAVIPDVASLLWTGGSSSFAILSNDGQLQFVTVAGRLNEFRRVPRAEAGVDAGLVRRPPSTPGRAESQR